MIIKEDDREENTSAAHMGQKGQERKILVGKPERMLPFTRQRVDGKIILKRILTNKE
jgi:hypothetical protein